MGVIRTLRSTVAGWLAPEVRNRGLERSFVENPAEWMKKMFGGGKTASGTDVTPTVALATGFGVSVRNIAEDLASLPFVTYERKGERAKRRDPDFHLYPILHDEPNPEMDSMQFVETMQLWAFLYPGAYAEVVRDGMGKIVALWPLFPDRVTVLRVNGEIVFHVKLPDGQLTADGRDYALLARDRVFHLRGFSIDAVKGVSRLETHREAIGLSIALEEHGARFFSNGASLGQAFEHPGRLGDVAYKRLLAAFESRHKGLANAHRTAILEEGMKVSTGKSISENKDAQFLENRKFQIAEGARAVRMPLHLIGEMDRATWNNIEHAGIDYVVHTIRPIAVRWERAVHRQLLTADERKTHYSEFLLDALMRGDSKSRAETLQIWRLNGIINADDWLEIENRDPLPEDKGKAYWMPSNMTEVGEEPPPAPPPPAGGAPPPPGQPPPAPPAQEQEMDEEEERALRAAFQPLFEHALQRVLHKEAAAITKAGRRAGSLVSLEGAVKEFYAEHVANVRSALEPVALSLARLLGAGDAEARAHAADAASHYTRAAMNDIGLAVLHRPEDPGAAVEQLTGKWLKSRAAELAPRELDHAIDVLSKARKRAAAA